MELTINQHLKIFPQAPNNIASLLIMEFGILRKGIAVAVNNRVVPEHLWEITPLSNNDNILIITASQGG